MVDLPSLRSGCSPKVAWTGVKVKRREYEWCGAAASVQQLLRKPLFAVLSSNRSPEKRRDGFRGSWLDPLARTVVVQLRLIEVSQDSIPLVSSAYMKLTKIKELSGILCW